MWVLDLVGDKVDKEIKKKKLVVKIPIFLFMLVYTLFCIIAKIRTDSFNFLRC